MAKYPILILSVLLRAVLPVAFAGACLAAPVKTPHVEAELISRYAAFQPGKPIELALRLKIIDHWHTYWQNPGDSGLPTRLDWTLPGGFTAGSIEWPHPKRLPLGPLMNFGYEGDVLHLVSVQTPKDFKIGEPIKFAAKADWLVCSDVCIPESANLSITLQSVNAAPLPDVRWIDAFAKARAALPAEMTNWRMSAKVADGKVSIEFSPPSGVAVPLTDIAFFPLREELIANAAPQILTKTDAGYRIETSAADPIHADLKSADGVLVSSNGWGAAHSGNAITFFAPLAIATAPGKSLPRPVAATSPPPSPPAESLGLFAALLFAFGGGLLLNLMPCVFPVLGIKVMGFARHSQSDAAKMRKQGFAFLGGVIVSFWLLAGALIALRAAGESVGWGFQLQSPMFVSFLAALFMLMALNLSGVFEMGLGVQSAAGGLAAPGRGALIDAFFSGVLATVVATPCTAPMMGAALGFTLSQPAATSLLVFTAIALGMATPVFMLSLMPKWLRYLPRPGAWMDTLKQVLAFPLYATVVWLVWVLGAQIGNDGVARLLFGLTLLSLAAWLYGHWQLARPRSAVIAALLVAIMGLAIAWPETKPVGSTVTRAEEGWVPFSAKKIAELRAEKKSIFVDFTATWCITCQVNKRVALNREDVIQRFKELGVVRMKADWTVQDPEITRALAEFGRNGVPLYVFYPAGGEAVILPEVLTPALVLAAISPGTPALAAR